MIERARHPVLDEIAASRLALDRLRGSSAKMRLALDLEAELRRRGRLRVLDVGCAGPSPLNLWKPFVPLREQLELVGVDVAGLERADTRARELGLVFQPRQASADELVRTFGEAAFDAVVSTQVLEHLPDWWAALREMRDVVAPGGILYVTCDSGELARPPTERVRLAGKRVYARVWSRLGRQPPARRLFPSGEWERAPRAADLAAAAHRLGLEIERLAPYALRTVKEAQRPAGPVTQQLWLALEEALLAEAGGTVDAGLYSLLYLRARRPA